MRNRLMAIIYMLVLAAAVFVIVAIDNANNQSSVTASAGGVVSYTTNADIRITEIMFSNKAAVNDGNGNFYDYVEIYNASDSSVSLDHYSLTDDSTDVQKSPLTGISIPAKGYAVVWCSGLTQQGHASFKISQGETVGIYDANGKAVDAVMASGAQSNQALMYVGGVWEVSTLYSPGFENTEYGHSEYSKAYKAIGSTPVRINEAMTKNVTTYILDNGTAPDWVELYNASASAVDISGWSISDDVTDPQALVFPNGTIIEAGGYLMIACDKYLDTASAPMHAPFGLSSGGDSIYLYDDSLRLVDELSVPMLENDFSFGRSSDGSNDTQVFSQGTPLLPNGAEGAAQMARALIANNETGLIITEVMSANYSSHEAVPGSGIFPDWVEITNTSDTAQSLSGLYLGTSVNRLTLNELPDLTVASGSSVVIYADSELDELDIAGKALMPFDISQNGETVYLAAEKGRLLDKIAVPKLSGDLSYGRSAADGGVFYYYDSPTPGAENLGAGYGGVAPSLEPSVKAGVYNESAGFDVEFSVPDDVSLYYTLDGSVPNMLSQKYAGAIHVNKTTVIRTCAYKNGCLSSDVNTFSYIVNENHTVPVVSLSAEHDDLFSDEKGIYAKGPNYEYESGGYHTKANYWQDWERPVHMEYYDTDGNRLLSQDAGIKISGATSVEQAQKSLLIIARKEYGGKNRLEFNPFPNREFEEYKAIVLRSTSQDYYRARMRDAMLSSLLDINDNLYYQDHQCVVVYINGEYWGQYYIRERINKYSVAQHEGITDQSVIDNIDILSGSGRTSSQTDNGDTKDYQALVKFCKENDLRDPDNLKVVTDWVDVENLFDYFSFEIMIGNSDPSNIRFYRPKVEGAKWKWIVYDLDWSYNTGDNGASYNSFDRMLKESGIGRNNTDSTVIRALLKNPDMEKLFLERFAIMFNEVFDPERVHARIDEFTAILEPEMARQIARWSEEEAYSYSYERWQREVGYLHSYIDNCRPFILQYCQEWFKLTDSEMEALFGENFN